MVAQGGRNRRGGPREGAQGRSFSGDGGTEMAQGTLSGAGGGQEEVAQERRLWAGAVPAKPWAG